MLTKTATSPLWKQRYFKKTHFGIFWSNFLSKLQSALSKKMPIKFNLSISRVTEWSVRKSRFESRTNVFSVEEKAKQILAYYCKHITFGWLFFKHFWREAAFAKLSTSLNAMHICIREDTFSDTLIPFKTCWKIRQVLVLC